MTDRLNTVHWRVLIGFSSPKVFHLSNSIRRRVRAQMPMALLTLTSIVQALALELLWSHAREAGPRAAWNLESAIHWTQIASTLIGIMLIWIIYSNNVMRFVWTPSTRDSVLPFVFGIVEFMLIESLGAAHLGWWMIDLALIFAIMTWTSQITLRSARIDGSNDAFFERRTPATWRDFLPSMVIVALLSLAGIYLIVSGDQGVAALAIVIVSLAILVRQFADTARFWRDSLREVETSDEPPRVRSSDD